MSSKYVPIPKEDTYLLIKKANNGDIFAKEQLVEQNTGLVKNIALKFVVSGYEFEDLLQIGYIGLLKAIEKFDISYDVMFSTYAVPMIMGEIKRHIRDDGKIKMSRSIKIEIRELKRAEQNLYNKFGKQPKISQIAEEMEITKERVLELIEAEDALSNVVSFENLLELGETTHQSIEYNTPESQLDMMIIKKAIGQLTEKERIIIVLRYYKDMTQQQIASRMGISQVQVSRIEKKAINSIKEKMVE